MSILPLSRLKGLAQDALAYLNTQPDISEAEVFVSANSNLTIRLNYTSRIPSNGVEEPKSVESYGLGLRIAFNSPEGVKTGFGSEPTDLSLEGVRKALDKAWKGAVLDPDYVSLPHGTGRAPALRRYHDPAIMRISNGKMLEVGWETVEKALEVFTSSEELLNAAASPERGQGHRPYPGRRCCDAPGAHRHRLHPHAQGADR